MAPGQGCTGEAAGCSRSPLAMQSATDRCPLPPWQGTLGPSEQDSGSRRDLTFVRTPSPRPRYVCPATVCRMSMLMNPGPITTIRELVQELLRHRDPSAYGVILERYAVPSRDLEPYFRWNSRHYTRTCIHRNDDFELLVICYEPGQRTSVHDFNSQTAWIHPVQGEVVEDRFVPDAGGWLQLTSEVRLRAGEMDLLTNGNAIHRFTNRGPDRAVTLNLYAKPLSKWRVYDERTGRMNITSAGPPQ